MNVVPFTCLRCGHGYRAEHEKGVVVERSCPKCGSNSVRAVPQDTGAKAAVDEE